MRINYRTLVAVLLFSATLVLAACRTLPLNGKLPDELTASKIASVEENAPFAVAPDGNVVALVSSGLQLLHVPSKERVLMTAKTPRKLAWSPFGTSLAALFIEGQQSRVIAYDQYGTTVAEAVIEAQLTDIGWLAEDEIALGGAIIKQFKFGSNYRTILYRWKPGHDLPVAADLRDTTLRPATIKKWLDVLNRGPLMDFSSQTPLISYLHPVDPPLFNAYYKLIVKDLASGKELEVASVGLFSGGAKLSADGEKLLFGAGNGETVLRNPWSAEDLIKADSPGLNPSLSAATEIWFADGALFRSGELLSQLAPGAMAQFTADGSRLFLSAGSGLYLLRGLKTASETLFVPSLVDKVQKLRSLRTEGLISAAEYKEAIKRIAQQ